MSDLSTLPNINMELQFVNRAEFRKWLDGNCQSSAGVWLLFGKSGGPKTLTATEALEEALCFGWIDGQMAKIDERSYKKYFAPRQARSKWSEKNKAIVADLEKRGLMTDFGREKIAETKKNGMWDAQDLMKLTDEQIEALTDLLKEYGSAYANYQNMPPSVRKTYARAYYDAKTDAGREKRLAWIVDRLDKNLRPI